MKRDQDIEAWRVFLAVARAGTISAACDECDADASSISRTVSALEMALGGVALFDRSTRPFKLTENGKLAKTYAEDIVRSHDDLMNSIEKDFDVMAGPIRVGLPPMLQVLMRDFIVRFVRQYPEVMLSIFEYRAAPPIRFDGPDGKFDIIAAYGPDPAHDSIVQIHYGDGIPIPCASPDYLARNGVPKHPDDLIHHRGVVFESSMRSGVRLMVRGKETASVKFGRSLVFDSGQTALSATLGGGGISPGMLSVNCAEELASGRLVPVLSGWHAPAVHMYIYTRPELVKFRRIRVFIEEYRLWIREKQEKTHELLKGRVPDVFLEEFSEEKEKF